MNDRVGPNRPICYIEFGVYKGESMQYWTTLNQHSESQFFGLDTFMGLPDDWLHYLSVQAKGTYTTNGVVPCIGDKRLTFIKGSFQDTLYGLLETIDVDKKTLIVNYDADLYSSTLFGLTSLDKLLQKQIDSYIALFDEFFDADNEFRAFDDYVTSFRRTYEVVAHVGKSYRHAAIVIKR
jgi:hypothetical protein